MEHKISLEMIGSPQAEAMTDAISTCVHCGFCLPACPTYQLLGEEMDSPRGRIVLMRAVLEKKLPLVEAAPYLDRCLGCLGCVTACPSGVKYGELITSFRAHTETKRRRPFFDSLARKMASTTLPNPDRFRWAAWMGRWVQPFAFLFPSSIGAMLRLVPHEIARQQPLEEFYPAIGVKRGCVGMLIGCVQQAIAPEINRATLQVLRRNGFDVVIPKRQSCCGALHMHTGEAQRARLLAAMNFDLFDERVECIITNAAGCGSAMKEYELLFHDHELEEKAKRFSSRIQDISQFLSKYPLEPFQSSGAPVRIAYHDACHLAHAQGIAAEPRQLLSSIPGVEVVEIPDGEICCGSAGTYNIEQPDIARELGNRKAKNIHDLKVDAVVTGNIGCMVQLRKHLAEIDRKRPLPVMHTVEFLETAYDGKFAERFRR